MRKGVRQASSSITKGPSNQWRAINGAVIDTSGGDAMAGICETTGWNFTTAGAPVETFANGITNPAFATGTQPGRIFIDVGVKGR